MSSRKMYNSLVVYKSLRNNIFVFPLDGRKFNDVRCNHNSFNRNTIIDPSRLFIILLYNIIVL